MNIKIQMILLLPPTFPILPARAVHVSHTSFTPRFYEENVSPGDPPTQATQGESTFDSFPYKTWRTVYMKNKTLIRPCNGKDILPARRTFLHINTLACPAL